MLNIQFDTQPEKILKKVDKVLRERLVQKIEFLRIDPIPHDAKRIVNRKEKTFRVRELDCTPLFGH